MQTPSTLIPPVIIGGNSLGRGLPCFFIAEAGVNHNGDMDLAHRMIDETAKAKADAVKFQSFISEDVVTPQALKADYQVTNTGKRGGQLEMLKALELTLDQHRELKRHCEAAKLVYLSTPYEETSADQLDGLDVAAFKVASTDNNNIPFLRHLASKKRPIILSTGMCDMDEVRMAVDAIRGQMGDGSLVLLHCTSEYPAPAEEANLMAMRTLETAFSCPVGFSDHTQGIEVASWAAALGASCIEKHFTLDRSLPGPDHRASLEPDEIASLVSTIRRIETVLGNGVKQPTPSELNNKPLMRKCLVARRRIEQGVVIASRDVTAKRPASAGISPALYDQVIGKKAARAIEADSPIDHGDIMWDG